MPPKRQRKRAKLDEAPAAADAPAVQPPVAEEQPMKVVDTVPNLKADAEPETAGPSAAAEADAEAELQLEVTALLSDDEPADDLVDETCFAEELRLQKEREAKEAEQAKDKAGLVLSVEQMQSRFAALNHLLAQSGVFASFLEDQIEDIQKTLHKLGATVTSPKSGDKRKREEDDEGDNEAADNPQAGKENSNGNGPSSAAITAEPKFDAHKLLPLLQADLRDYQVRGVMWLIALYQNGINAILADQMGLGKTIQTIGFLSFLKSKNIHGPFIIVAPLSTLHNWVSEFHRFLPTAEVMFYHGTKKEREVLRRKLTVKKDTRVGEKYPIVVTSYEVIISDAKAYLSKIPFKYMVVDEGHRLKNFECRLIKELRTLNVENKLLLSGTPLQNNLAELWSLLNFLMPEVFRQLVDFEEWFDFAEAVGQEGADKAIIAAEQHNSVVSKLHSILKPFMLRRLKSDVDIDVPPKIEIVLYASMTDLQKQLNEDLKKGTLNEKMRAKAEEEGANAAAVGSLNNILMQMRKICNHPDLITSAYSTDFNYPTPEVLIAQCGKLALLDRLLKHLRKEGHKVLIFSQMVNVLDILDSFLDQQGINACRLDGSHKWQDRQASIERFNKDPNSWVFLLSTRAGGLGINLTAADTVIIYDSDWNPHQDLQAMDRCHRIGQTRPVLVFRLATSHSVEVKMLKRAADKMALERLVIKKGAFKGIGKEDKKDKISMSAAELMELLQGTYKLDDDMQSGVVSDEVLGKLLDRSHMTEEGTPLPYPVSGVGYEVVQGAEAAGILTNVNK